MNESVIKFRIGVVVLAVAIAAGIMVVMFSGRPALIGSTYTIHIHFEDAPGVTKDTPVRKFGILIGRVTDVRFADQDDRFPEKTGVNVSAAINADRELRSNEICRISSALFGDAVLQFVPGEKGVGGEALQNNDRIYGTLAKNPLDSLSNLEEDLRLAVRAVTRAGNEFGSLSQHVNQLISDNDDQLARIVNKAESALDQLQVTASNANGILGDDELRNALKKTLRDIPDVLNETRDAITSVRTAATLANKNLANLENFTRPLGENGEVIAENVSSGVERLDELLEQLVGFSRALNNSEGTLGLLVNDPELYQRLTSAATTVEQLTKKLRPVIDDARVFTDKIARDPGELGVRGALKKRAPIK